jgi:predicted O-methyltransferase YrrM
MNLPKLCNESWKIGETINLSSIQRNPTVGKGATDYYHFLAGFVRFNSIQTVVEVGTHFGGSALAMLAGGSGRMQLIVTVDISDQSEPYLRGKEKIIKVVGDGASRETAEAVLGKIGTGVDLLYIDTLHTYQCTFETFATFYPLLKPKWIILDDITLNDEMKSAWTDITSRFVPESCVNVAALIPSVRRGRAGFGLIAAHFVKD